MTSPPHTITTTTTTTDHDHDHDHDVTTPSVSMDAVEQALRSAFDGSPSERRVVARQARDLADAGIIETDRGETLTVATVIDNLSDAPDDLSIAERWNWWLGALETAYGGYHEFQVTTTPDTE
ncbi:MAG: hypothetical protein J07HQW2_02477 [Haloquadratum walsbyi J07HQW2]|uniref:Uncharacterized protein n=2 Tax=Haloquadratum walsbyi TaxID=293091 RepID=U1PUG0_9EURY|nr:MAG: hypothetical protein J07HQW2_02477 [Haloquadratum walsbyi J07HQW2]